jgi:hypothetical protein
LAIHRAGWKIRHPNFQVRFHSLQGFLQHDTRILLMKRLRGKIKSSTKLIHALARGILAARFCGPVGDGNNELTKVYGEFYLSSA